MKIKYLFIIAGVFLSNNTYSQEIINVIKDFYKNADMNCYIDKAQKRMMEEYELIAQQSQWDSIFRSHVPPPNIDLHQGNTIPILNIQFVNTENYSYTNNIYNYITIDSIWAFTFFHIDKRMKINAIVNNAATYVTYFIYDKKSRYDRKWQYEETKFLKSINKQKPELILRCAIISGGFGKKFDDGYMYVKDDKIYKYVMHNGKSYELNEYFRMTHLENTRSYLNLSYIPLIYQKEERDTRRTGNAPKNEMMICPRLP